MKDMLEDARLSEPQRIIVVKLRAIIRVVLFVCISIGGFILWRTPYLSDGAKHDCDDGNELQISTNWTIASGSGNTKILWQRHSSSSQVFDPTHQPNSGLVVTDQQVVYVQDAWDTCNIKAKIIAFNVSDGRELWRVSNASSQYGYSPYGYSSLASVFRSINAISDGYILVSGDHWVFRLDTKGEIIWWNDELPSRSIETVFEVGDKLYLPSFSQIYEVDKETGTLQNIIKIPNLVRLLRTLVLTINASKKTVQVSKWPAMETLFELPTDNPYYEAKSLLDLWPLFNNSDRMLLTYDAIFSPKQVQALDIQTGELKWRLAKQFTGFPIVMNDHMIGYSSDGIEIYDVSTGILLDQIVLRRNVQESEDQNTISQVWIAGNNNILALNFRDTQDIVVLELTTAPPTG